MALDSWRAGVLVERREAEMERGRSKTLLKVKGWLREMADQSESSRGAHSADEFHLDLGDMPSFSLVGK